MKLVVFLYACGFSSYLIGMDSRNSKTKLFGMIMILVAMLTNIISIVL